MSYIPQGSVANSISRGAFSSRPSAGTANRLYYCTDVPVVFYDNGSAWVPYWGSFPGTPPPAVSSLTWVNQGSISTASDDKGTLLFSCQKNGGGDDNHLLVQATSGTTWTFEIGYTMLLNPLNNPSANMFGAVLRDSVDGSKLIRFVTYFTGNTVHMNCQKYNSPTSGNSVYTDGALHPVVSSDGGPFWLRIDRNVTLASNLTFAWSINGNEYQVFEQRGITDFLPNGPNQVGILGDSVGGQSNPTKNVQARVFHWSFA